ncbi:MAG TPA: hypothetical protein VFM53_06955 [Anaeromyxobacteraceae bacterium]|nr:hypothetical protein [Anaeromyxobacteraceae bacterium]
MKTVRNVALCLLLAAGFARAAEPTTSSAETARRMMHDAMLKQAGMPMRPAVLPLMRPGEGVPPPPRVPPARPGGDAARQKAMGSGMRDADAVRAEMANRAARGGGAAGAMMQNGGDMMNAPMMQRAQGMNPGGGMMPGGGGMGPGGGGPGGGMGGGMGGMNSSAAQVQPSGH